MGCRGPGCARNNSLGQHMRRIILFVFVVLISCVDVPIFLGFHQKINELLIEREAHRLIVIEPFYVLALQILQLIVVGAILFSMRKRQLHRGFTLGSTFLVSLLLLRMLYTGYEAFTVPFDRGRLLRTGVRVQALSGALSQYRASHSVFPESISETDVPRGDLYDGWGCRFEYQKSGDGLGYNLGGLCVPERLSWMGEKYERCFVEYTSTSEPGETELTK